MLNNIKLCFSEFHGYLRMAMWMCHSLLVSGYASPMPAAQAMTSFGFQAPQFNHEKSSDERQRYGSVLPAHQLD
ncbi:MULTISPECIES: hypothetical protein [Acetobacter]|uniref:hypothetical protein n=1 Tax=Acetobacter TaxID=434 RepID=UPI0013C30B2D|nr:MULTISPECIES: hypothetical protein [Acetobacter]